MPLHVSSTVVLIIRGQNYIIQHLVLSHSVGGCPVHRLREDSQYIPVHVSSTVVPIIRRSKLYYTASGIVTLCRWLSSAQVERGFLIYSCTCFEHCCAHHQEVKIVLYSIWYRHIIRPILAINQLNAQNLVL